MTERRESRTLSGRPIRKARLYGVSLACAACIAAAVGCGDPVGKYTDSSGTIMLELKPGGSATFSFAGVASQCSWAADGTKLNVDCKGDIGKLTFNVGDGGYLWGPPPSDSPLRKVRD